MTERIRFPSLAMAKATVNGPNLPANMVKIMSIRPIEDSSGVNPIDRPIVPLKAVTKYTQLYL